MRSHETETTIVNAIRDVLCEVICCSDVFLFAIAGITIGNILRLQEESKSEQSTWKTLY